MLNKNINVFIACGLLLGSFLNPNKIAAALSYPGCTLADGDFQAKTLATFANDPTLIEPLKMAFDMDAQGNTDVYFIQRAGLIRKYVAATNQVVNIFQFPADIGGGSSADGLVGIALDPDFKINHWMYLFYTVSLEKHWRLSRFTVANNTIDMNSEKILLRVGTKGSSQHTGGAMQFDVQGNLWLNIGENSMIGGGNLVGENTFDLRGKIIRIKPKPIADNVTLTSFGPGITYDIPKGNLFPEGTAKTKPEIYVMGVRNPYTLALDQVRKGIAWGDVGPDAGAQTEEHNFTTVPMNGGWPFWSGNQVSNGNGGGTPDAPVNTKAGDTALTNLPPSIPAIHSYQQSCAITGPIYYYHPSYPSKNKLPPQFEGVWFTTDYSQNTIQAHTLDATGKSILNSQYIFTNIKISRVLDFQLGPDGVLYLVNYAGSRSAATNETAILKIEYKGSCQPTAAEFNDTTLKYFIRPTTGLSKKDIVQGNLHIEKIASKIFIRESALLKIAMQDLSGKTISQYTTQGPTFIDLSTLKKTGVYFLNIETKSTHYKTTVIKN